MSQAQEQFDLVGYVKAAFEAAKDPDKTYPVFDRIVVNKGNVIPSHAKVLKQAGYVINTIKATGTITGNLVVSIYDPETMEEIVVYSSHTIDQLSEVVTDQFDVEYVDDFAYDNDEAPELSSTTKPEPKKSLFKRILGL